MAQHQFVVRAKENSLTGGVALQAAISPLSANILSVSVFPDDMWTSRPDSGPEAPSANGLSNPAGLNIGNFSKDGGSFLFVNLGRSVDGGQTFLPSERTPRWPVFLPIDQRVGLLRSSQQFGTRRGQ